MTTQIQAITIRLPEKLHKEILIKCIKMNTSMQEQVLNFLKDWSKSRENN